MEKSEDKKKLFNRVLIWSTIFEVMISLITVYMFFILLNQEIFLAILSLIIAICSMIYISTLNRCVRLLMEDKVNEEKLNDNQGND